MYVYIATAHLCFSQDGGAVGELPQELRVVEVDHL